MNVSYYYQRQTHDDEVEWLTADKMAVSYRKTNTSARLQTTQTVHELFLFSGFQVSTLVGLVKTLKYEHQDKHTHVNISSGSLLRWYSIRL